MNAQTTKPESGPVNGGPLVHSPVRISLSLDTLPAIREYCGILAKTSMVPRGYVGKADDILIAIMHGFELGLPPLQALQSIATINGISSIYGDAALALVRRSEKLESFEEWIEVDGKRVDGPVDVVQLADGEKKNVVAFCRSKGIGMAPRTTWFSVADAKRARLWLKKSKDGVESPWCHYPQRMLMWRARGWNLHDNYGDVLKGLAIAEEALDIAMAPGSDGVHRMAAEVARSASPATESAPPALRPPTLQPNGQAKGDALLKKTGHLATPPAPPHRLPRNRLQSRLRKRRRPMKRRRPTRCWMSR